ncbi:hypothetical protein E2C01_079163 [Portunus trituberculatus]|uniref:Uncharacterized protein n=1 Tax=Portunus trituberculatus TaxID=210409 RepID=A0A5B7IPK2_PORTR|nr:hypothetical protein [Portunus trituberculatus]
MDNASVVHCLNCQGSSKSEVLLFLLEIIFWVTSARSRHLLAAYVPSEENLWADTFFLFQHTSLKWQLCPKTFRKALVQT